MQRMFKGLFTKDTPPPKTDLTKALLLTNSKAVHKELLNTYLSVRITEGLHGWANIDVSKPPVAGVQHGKLVIVAKLAREIPSFSHPLVLEDNDIKKLRDFVATLLELESSEREVKNATGSLPFGSGLASFVIRPDSLLERTMHAMRSFTLEQFKCCAPKEFASLKDTLSAVINNLTSEIASARKNPSTHESFITNKEKRLKRFTMKFDALIEAESSSYHLQFFNEIVMNRNQCKDEDGKPVSENSFNDYLGNIILGIRTPTLLDKLLIAMPAPATSDLQNSSTFSEAIDIPLAVTSSGLRRS